jgi:poly(3-hydroxybutyrate) depolymerase
VFCLGGFFVVNRSRLVYQLFALGLLLLGGCRVRDSNACTPKTCAAQGKNCGTASDGCGNTLNCGTCSAPEACDGGGVANGCGNSGGDQPARSPGCGAQLPAGGGGTFNDEHVSVRINGVDRRYLIRSPRNYNPQTAYPAFFYFHWLDGTIEDVVSGDDTHSIWSVPGADQAIYIVPQGLDDWDYYAGTAKPGEWGWRVSECSSHDFAFVDAMLERVRTTRCINEQRVFAGGFSFGAEMSLALACCRGPKLRAVAPATGTLAEELFSATCTGPTPAIRMDYGTRDTAFTQEGFRDTTAWARARHGCSAAYDVVPEGPAGAGSTCKDTWNPDPSRPLSCECRAYRDCAQPVIECVVQNLVHTTSAGWRYGVWDWINTNF